MTEHRGVQEKTIDSTYIPRLKVSVACKCRFPCVPKQGFKVDVPVKRQEIQETGQGAVGQGETSKGENQQGTPGGQEETRQGDGEQDESLQDAGGQEETREVTGGKDETWQEVGGPGRFKCPICGKTRNTRSKLEKHMSDHEEDIDDGSATCRICSHQTRSEEELKKHILVAHEIFKCTQCHITLKTKRDITTHMKENHKSYKPCDYFLEDRCDLDGECRYNHVKLKPGQQICYKCGDKFNLKSDMRRHIVETHGNDICHKFMQNNCTARKCFFSHDVITAQNVIRNAQRDNPRVPTQQDFYELPTARPAGRRQEVAQSLAPAAPMSKMWQMNQFQMPEVIAQAITQQIQTMLPQIIAQIKDIIQPMST